MAEPVVIRDRIIGLRRVPARDLLDNAENWRRHPKNQRDAMAGVLQEIGYADALLARETPAGLMLIDGHLRKEVTPEQDVPVLVLDLTEEEARLLLATHDPLGAMALTDSDALDALLHEVTTGDDAIREMLAGLAAGAGLNYGGAAADVPEDPGADIDRAEELREKWQTAAGQLWEIPSTATPGRSHRLLCGDSTKAEDVARLMGGEKAALLATDPPYNVGVDYGDASDDAKVEADYITFCRAWFEAWQAVSERQIVTPGCYNLASWARLWTPYHVAPWTKTNSMTNGKVARWWCWEPIFFFGASWPRQRANDVFDYPIGQQSETGGHPCPKPLKMWIDLFENYSDRGDLVADAFDGAGTSLVAAEQTGRVCYGMELEPKYVAVALERMAGMGLEPRMVRE